MRRRAAIAVAETLPRPDEARDFWTGVLGAAGATTLPAWISRADPPRGIAEVARLGGGIDLADRLGRTATALGVPLSAVLLAAHAAVLATLTGERNVTTGIRRAAPASVVGVPVPPPLPCRVHLGEATWTDLIRHAHEVQTGITRHAGYPVGALAAELGVAGPVFSTLLDLRGGEPALADRAVTLAVRAEFPGDRVLIRLSYRTEVFDAEHADRIAGYYLTALYRIADDPGARHDAASLLSVGERRHQLEGLAGPVLPVPDRRFHELFEEQVRRNGNAPAAVHGHTIWTYGLLNRRANQIAAELTERGLTPEDVVGVALPRGLPWLATLLGVLKAGGVYLPLDPTHPADRLDGVLRRSSARFLVSEDGGYLGGATGLDVRSLGDGYARHDPRLPIGAGQLAYVYFTSGSTGEPKGAMCEHAGLLNHLYAKIEDFGVEPGMTVAQTAPQCFDISLWQLLAPLLVGARTRIVSQESVLDVERFLDEISDVDVLQVVPSYLEVLLTHLERHPRDLPRLRCVSVTGEAVKKELVERWFARFPGRALANAYGLTETSDDTNHEVMRSVPGGDRVPLGRPVRNVRVYVVDERLEPVPLGAPGEIVFSGVCVGRGYINDPERTRAAFGTDPYREGERLYRSGDFGRWRPDGKLEFLGRRDAQVKIRGFRIELGEIENRLLRVPGVRDGAVIVTAGPALAAFYTGDALPEAVHAVLGAGLPEYMVPSALHPLPVLPLTANGKIDRKALAARPAPAEEPVVLGTATERHLAEAWSEVLGVPVTRIGRDHHFFDAGGTSLAAVRLLAKLDRRVSLRELHRNPVLGDLAGLLDTTPAAAAAPAVPSAAARPAVAGPVAVS